MRELPKGWAWTALNEIVNLNARHSHLEISDETLVTFLPMPSVEAETGRIDLSRVRPWIEVKKGYTNFQNGDVIFAKITPCMENGKVAVCSDLQNGIGAGSTEFHVLRPQPNLEAKYLLFYLLQQSIRREARRVMQGAAGQLRVPASFLANLHIPLPPLPEQRRIVAEIEKQFTRLDAAMAQVNASLRKIQLLTSSILEAAFAREWPTKPLRQLAHIKGGITKDTNRRDLAQCSPVPYLRVANVQRGFLDLAHVKEIMATSAEIAELELKLGDILFTEGGDRDKLGRGWIWQGEIEGCIHQNHVFRARVNGSVLPKWVSYYANGVGQSYFFREGKQTTNLASINITKLGSLPIPTPPIEEQQQILDQLEANLTEAQHLETGLIQVSLHAARLRQAILAAAFSGQLVPQDPGDEPAFALLERLLRARSHVSSSRRAKRQSRSQLELDANG